MREHPAAAIARARWLPYRDADGARIAYDAQHAWYGVEVNPGGGAGVCNITDITVTRIALLN